MRCCICQNNKITHKHSKWKQNSTLLIVQQFTKFPSLWWKRYSSMLPLLSPLCCAFRTHGLQATALRRISEITCTQYIWARLNLYFLHFVAVLRYYGQLGCVLWLEINHRWNFHPARWTGFEYTYILKHFVCSKSGSKNTCNTAHISKVKTLMARPTVYKHVLWNGLVFCDASHSGKRCILKGKSKYRCICKNHVLEQNKYTAMYTKQG